MGNHQPGRWIRRVQAFATCQTIGSEDSMKFVSVVRKPDGRVIPNPDDRDSSAADGIWQARGAFRRRRAKPRLDTMGRDQRATV
jgi:hypothetical protein